MHLDIVQRILGMLLMVFSFTMLPPALVALIAGDSALPAFLYAFALLLGVGTLMWYPVRRVRRDLRTRDGFLVVVLIWMVLGLAGAVPFAISEDPSMSVVDAVFEGLSGLTTTGATVIVGIDQLPRSILFYRQQLHWMGGMGIIVLAVAILPMLGVGGMQLYRAEMPGPVKDAKLTPRIAETAKALWYIYLWLTVACAVAYWLAGMSAFDAVAHAFSTVATGGFSTHDASIGYFDSVSIELITIVFMLISAVNYSLHFVAWRGNTLRNYWRDAEFRFFIQVTVAVLLLVTLGLWVHETFSGAEALRQAVFQVVSVVTSTGYTTASFYLWPSYLPVLLIFLSFMGGCASSTSGGMKQVRFLLLAKQGRREVLRLIHPQAQVLVKVGDRAVNERVIDSVWGFFATYVAAFAAIMLLLMALGVDQVTAFSAVAACINNLGPGLGEVGAHFGNLPTLAKWALAFAMLLGRLEIFTLLVILTPAFWRR
ncbi:TrkH family potassium uptake protein [Alkalilimnicola sp. S0819]|uniref:TrkH family potassium uptake protein n=1 Tax=Alkalilimnicola sp. S0819 TaxID=2613922 RepID=UPI001261F2D4|nr:TrkH family potassium uptake protein [Alkalilimnicola sp. S0819]KAB7627249.1 potassium transporter [Alkalilimnicola sp. S0819]MPQ15962.1 potassium transporter [Alkalilimnicola sp. S0819]